MNPLINTQFFHPIPNVSGVQQTPRGVELTVGTERVAIDVVRDDIVRLRLSTGGSFDENPTFAACFKWPEATPLFSVEEQDDKVILKTDKIHVVVDRNPFSLSAWRKDGSCLFESAPGEGSDSGLVTLNDTLMHIANSNLPFGGVGDSGIGAYHGKHSFDLFSHQKSILHRSFLVEEPIRYAPYKVTRKWIKRIMRWAQ